MQNLVIGHMRIARSVGVFLGVFVIDPIHLCALENGLTGHLGRAQRGRGIGCEIRVTGAGGKDADALFLKVAHGAASDIGLADLIHRDGRDHAGVNSDLLQRRLHGQRVHHGGQHAHVIGGGPLHPLGRPGQTAEDIAAADHHANLDPHIADRLHLLGNPRHGRGMQAIALIAHQRLARDFEHDAVVFDPRFGGGVGHGFSLYMGVILD